MVLAFVVSTSPSMTLDLSPAYLYQANSCRYSICPFDFLLACEGNLRDRNYLESRQGRLKICDSQEFYTHNDDHACYPVCDKSGMDSPSSQQLG
jgi:hypothetical protein